MCKEGVMRACVHAHAYHLPAAEDVEMRPAPFPLQLLRRLIRVHRQFDSHLQTCTRIGNIAIDAQVIFMHACTRKGGIDVNSYPCDT